jgi:hypothetical protein
MAQHVRYSQQHTDLFAPLTADQVWAIEQTLANGRLEGWDPDRSDVADLIDYTLGKLTRAEYVSRASERRAAGRVAV